MHLVIGLGNPGAKYAANRHNIGYQIVDLLAQQHQLSFDKTQHSAQVAMGVIGDAKVILAKPLTYMNESGRAVSALVNYYKVPLDQLIVVVDDLDLEHGTIRLRPQGGSAGQKGMKSIIQHLGTQEFARLRVGIGRPPGRMDPASYVLQDFTAEQEAEVAVVRQEAVDALELWLAQDIVAAMNHYNS